MNNICGQLSDKEKERQYVLGMMKSGVKATSSSSSKSKSKSKSENVDSSDLNAWEKKLKEIEKG